MKKFKLNEKGFLDSSYNLEEIKKKFEDEIAKGKSKLSEFQEGIDYTISYEGQKKVYKINSPQLKKIYWGDNTPSGFEYLIEEDSEGVRTKMKMIGSLGNYVSHQDNNFQGSIEANNSNRIDFDAHDDLESKINSLHKELQQKERDIQFLEIYPEKKKKVQIEIENIKSSIEELMKESQKKEKCAEEVCVKSNGKSSSRSSGKFVYLGIGIVSLLSCVCVLAVKILK